MRRRRGPASAAIASIATPTAPISRRSRTTGSKTNIRSKGPLGALYIPPCCIHEGDTPSFLGLINNGLASFMTPTYGGWGGRYVWRQYYGETRPSWTQGGDAYPGRDSSRDTVLGIDGQPRTSDQATIWRWRDAFQHDFAARMDWTIASVATRITIRVAIVNGQATDAPVVIDTTVGAAVALDAAGSTDPDGDALRLLLVLLPRGRHRHPVETGRVRPAGADWRRRQRARRRHSLGRRRRPAAAARRARRSKRRPGRRRRRRCARPAPPTSSSSSKTTARRRWCRTGASSCARRNSVGSTRPTHARTLALSLVGRGFSPASRSRS